MAQILDTSSLIKVKRSGESLSDLVAASTKLKYGEPLLLTNEKYLVIGDSNEDNTIDNDIFIAVTNKEQASRTLYGAAVTGSSNLKVVDKDNNQVIVDKSSLDISHKANQSTIEAMDFNDPSVPSTGTTTSLSFIDTISQTDGKITATKKNVQDGSTTQKGVVKLGATGGAATYEHAHGNLTSDGKIGTTADQAVYTTTGGVVTAGSLATTDPTASGNSTSFIDSISQDSKGKITATKKTIYDATASQKGIVLLGAANGAAAYSHSHNYAGSSSAGGAANSVASSLTFNNGGSGAASGTTYNGSAAKTISYNTIGAAASSHTHSYAASSSAGGAATNLNVNSTTANSNYYILGATGTDSQAIYRAYNASGSKNTGGIYFNGATGVLMGAAWNDIAEFRIGEGEPGDCVCENKDGKLIKSNKKLQKVPHIVSDTFGFAIGETDSAKTPIAISGRVLAKTDKDKSKFKVGDVVCAGKNGTVSKMNRLEIILFPDRILGKVSAIPDYKEWNSVNVNNRIWIQL